jgi:adenosylcobinamide kinase/adenosylcobinamide-phosphate guanylyltransferase
MELFIGGFAQNKLEYVKSLHPQLEDQEESKNFRLINDLHLFARERLKSGKCQEEIAAEIEKIIDDEEACGKKLLIISDEIGSGLVPLEKDDRAWREVTGRLLCLLAKRAEKVTRIVCGIGQVIKG